MYGLSGKESLKGADSRCSIEVDKADGGERQRDNLTWSRKREGKRLANKKSREENGFTLLLNENMLISSIVEEGSRRR
jgi:hypothetical protein